VSRVTLFARSLAFLSKMGPPAREVVMLVAVVVGVAVAVGGGLGIGLAGCGSSSKAVASCTATSCPAGTACVGGACAQTCSHHSDCAESAGFACTSVTAGADAGAGAGEAGVSATAPLVCQPGAVAKLAKQYGAACGLDLDADCDTASGFTCQGHQNDVDAFCTKLGGCFADTDCPAAMYCGWLPVRGCVNLNNCTTAAMCAAYPGASCVADGSGRKSCTIAKSCHTQPDDCGLGFACRLLPGDATNRFSMARACVPRGDCDPCTTDADCSGAGTACVTAVGGTESFCARSCEPGGTSCDPSSACTAVGDRGNFCVPRSGTCHGDMSPCSACRDNHDCGPSGVCQVVQETREQFCVEPCASDGTCPKAPGGGQMACCTSAADCGGFLGDCLPVPAQNPYPRSAFGCWLQPCTTNADCSAGELCDIRLQTQVSSTEQNTTCGTSGVCRSPHDPTDSVDFEVIGKVCNCAGKRFNSEADLAADPASAFKGCCNTVMSTSGATFSCS